MLTATKDLILSTTVTGSWPRPTWYTGNLFGQAFPPGWRTSCFASSSSTP